ncbi:hypothetical protein [Microbacterium sp.]|uniref:hypothetical protein n=1 Tax=Microbacterium sp. TaxID=51671 RepID=UPI00333F14BA
MATRPSAAVYRRRRLVVFGGLILVIVLIVAGVWLAIAQPWKGGDTPAPRSSSPAPTAPTPSGGTPAPTASTPASTPTPGDTSPALAACTTSQVQVTAKTDAETYAADVKPKLSISLKNTGGVDCTINVGSTKQVFTVTSGSDVWWRSTDCQKDPSDMIVTLKAGQEVSSSAPVEWDRTRSSVETCGSTSRPRAPGGGASYHLSVSIGGIDSASPAQFILK